ncbi:MAG: hypothetical protein HXS44_06905 [Theionarchaea archaeon]|nr:hypothetical protein [Theionarchaea archaeon]
MNIISLNTESKWYLSLWILIISVVWFLWFHGLDEIVGVWSYTLPLTFGLGTGMLSGLPPIRAFQAAFFGFCIVALPFLFSIPLVVPLLVFFGILTGLIALAAAIIRRLLLHQKIDIVLRSWQLISLTIGITLLVDIFTVPGTHQELFVDHQYLSFLRFLIPASVGLLGLGLFAGAFSSSQYKELVKSVMKLSIVAHGLFLPIFFIRSAIGQNIHWGDFAGVPLVGLFLFIVYKGIQIGYRSRGSHYP